MENNVNIYSIIDELRKLVEEAKNSPFSKNKSVDPEAVFTLLDNMKYALDETLEYARDIEREKDAVLLGAKNDADEILQNAKMRAQEMVTSDAITKAAMEQSQKILERTKQRANDMKRQAYQYSEGVFLDLQTYFNDSMELLNENINRLNGRGEN